MKILVKINNFQDFTEIRSPVITSFMQRVPTKELENWITFVYTGNEYTCFLFHIFLILDKIPEVYSEPYQTSKIEIFAKIVNVFSR